MYRQERFVIIIVIIIIIIIKLRRVHTADMSLTLRHDHQCP